jgi:hypothetical protein
LFSFALALFCAARQRAYTGGKFVATLKITDSFGLVIDATPDPGTSFAKYLKSPQTITGVFHSIGPLKDLLISDDPFQSQTIGIGFDEPITLGTTGVELAIKPSLSGTLSIIKGTSLFNSDTDAFREPVPIPEQHAYLGTALAAELPLTIGGQVTDLQFGFAVGSSIVLTSYLLCPLTEPIVSALERIFREFIIPGDLQDIEQLSERTLVTVEGMGSLKFSAKANLLAMANPLATLNTPFVPIKVAEGSGITINGVYRLTGGYQLRVERLEARRFRLGYHKKRTSEIEVSVQAQINTDVGAGSFDLLKSLLQAVSSDAVPDKDTFHQAGLTDDQLNTIAAAVKAGIERSIALSLTGDLDRLDSSSTAFSYEIDTSLLDDAGRQAIHGALDGDLTGLEAADHAGITRRTSIFETLRQGKRLLKVNLLGIYTLGSVTSLFQEGTIVVDRDAGDITITDRAGAERIQFTANNFAGDSAKLRRVLAESLLLTAVYRGAGGFMAGPQLASHYWFFELHQKTNQQQMADYLTIAEALHLLTESERATAVTGTAGITDFGRSTLFIDASYGDELCRHMFVDATGSPRQQDEYEAIGRHALLLLLAADESTTAARRLPLTDDNLWQAMRKSGQPGLPALFANKEFNANQLADITADYTLITWWATSMRRMGEALAAILAFLAAQPGVDRENNTFKQLRGRLETAMASVAANTQPQFGEPWGVIAMDLASGSQATTSLQVVSPRITLSLTQRALQGAAGHGD